jgi:hypothetical protein
LGAVQPRRAGLVVARGAVERIVKGNAVLAVRFRIAGLSVLPQERDPNDVDVGGRHRRQLDAFAATFALEAVLPHDLRVDHFLGSGYSAPSAAGYSGRLIDEEAELDRLYAAPREEFVKVRNELARRFREEGERAIATRIGELKKPTVSAWAVNQLARRRELDVQRLVNAGEALETAHREAISGGDASGFEQARRDEDAAVRRLLAAAEELGTASGATLDRIGRTLRAAAATPEGRRAVKQGRLEEDLEPPGFDALAGLAGAAPRAKKERKQTERKRPQREIETLRQRKDEADAESERAVEEARELERRAREAEQLAKKAQRAAESARKRADTAAAKAQRLEDQLSELQS